MNSLPSWSSVFGTSLSDLNGSGTFKTLLGEMGSLGSKKAHRVPQGPKDLGDIVPAPRFLRMPRVPDSLSGAPEGVTKVLSGKQ